MNRFMKKLVDSAPTVDTSYRIGMRVVKTVAAVTICLLIAWFIETRDSLPIAAIAAIITMQATHSDTLRVGIFRILGTVIGGIFGILTVLIGLALPYYSDGLFIVVIPVMLLANLYLCNLLKMQDSCSISCVVTLIIASQIVIDAPIHEALHYTFIRLRDTMIGVVVATLINMLPGLIKKYQLRHHESESAEQQNTEETIT